MNYLTLEWIEAGQTKQQQVSDQQITKTPGTVRIGRDATQVDIMIADMSVAPCHAEIYFSPQQQCFYLRNLRDTNPPVVNGMLLRQGEAMLDEGSTIQLGAIALQVRAVNLGPQQQQSSGGYIPTSYATQVTPNSTTPPTVAATNYQQTPPTFPRSQYPNTVEPTVAVSPGYHLPTPDTSVPTNRMPLLFGIGAAMLSAVVAGIVIASMPKIPIQSLPTTSSVLTQSFLTQAKDSEKKGNLGQAIELAQSATGPEASEAQSLIPQWKSQWNSQQDAFRKVEEAYGAGRWQETVDIAYNSIPRNDYWDNNQDLNRMALGAKYKLNEIANEQAKADEAARKSEAARSQPSPKAGSIPVGAPRVTEYTCQCAQDPNDFPPDMRMNAKGLGASFTSSKNIQGETCGEGRARGIISCRI